MSYVLIQAAGAFDPIGEWPVEHPPSDEAEFRHAQLWDDLCLDLVRRVDKGRDTLPVNVFLLFDQEEVLYFRDAPALQRLLARVRERSWGARVFLVLSGAIISGELIGSRVEIEEGKGDLSKWMEELVLGQVADFLQVHSVVDSRSPEALWVILRNAANHERVDYRQKVLRKVAAHRDWRCALPAKRELVADLLARMAFTDPASDSGSNLVIALATQDLEEQKRQIEQYVPTDGNAPRYPDRECLVASLIQRPTSQLQDYCERRKLAPVLHFVGEFELWYYLLRLNEKSAASMPALIRPVDLDPDPPLNVAALAPNPALLLTSAFSLDPGEMGQWLEAAKDVGEILHRTPAWVDRRVELAITRERLKNALSEMKHLNVWVHIGHGRGSSGLWVPGEGNLPADKWIGFFANRDLHLALFLTCDSHEIARQFAEAGAALAIGFEGKLEASKSRALAVEVLEAILVEGMGGGAILPGFRAGVAKFKSIRDLKTQVRAYYPRRI